MKKLFLTLLLFTTTAHAADKPLAVCTTGMVADVVKNVSGNLLNIRALMGPGVDPHLYKATHGDMKLINDADVIFYNGLKLEGKMQETFEKLEKKKRVVAIAASLNPENLLASPTYIDAKDPHVWFDVSLWEKTIVSVRDALIEMFPADSEKIKENADNYSKKLLELDLWAKEQLQTIPEEKRVLITAHDAFNYFGKAYGLEVMGLQGISTESEFGLQDIKRVSDVILERGVKSIFVETSVPEKFIHSLKEGVNARGGNVRVGGALFSDAMGEEGTPEGTYEGMVRHNVKTIVAGLK